MILTKKSLIFSFIVIFSFYSLFLVYISPTLDGQYPHLVSAFDVVEGALPTVDTFGHYMPLFQFLLALPLFFYKSVISAKIFISFLITVNIFLLYLIIIKLTKTNEKKNLFSLISILIIFLLLQFAHYRAEILITFFILINLLLINSNLNSKINLFFQGISCGFISMIKPNAAILILMVYGLAYVLFLVKLKKYSSLFNLKTYLQFIAKIRFFILGVMIIPLIVLSIYREQIVEALYWPLIFNVHIASLSNVFSRSISISLPFIIPIILINSFGLYLIFTYKKKIEMKKLFSLIFVHVASISFYLMSYPRWSTKLAYIPCVFSMISIFYIIESGKKIKIKDKWHFNIKFIQLHIKYLFSIFCIILFLIIILFSINIKSLSTNIGAPIFNYELDENANYFFDNHGEQPIFVFPMRANFCEMRLKIPFKMNKFSYPLWAWTMVEVVQKETINELEEKKVLYVLFEPSLKFGDGNMGSRIENVSYWTPELYSYVIQNYEARYNISIKKICVNTLLRRIKINLMNQFNINHPTVCGETINFTVLKRK